MLLVDCDPQFNATQYLVRDDVYLKHINDASKGTIKDIFIPKTTAQVSTVRGVAKSQNKSKLPIEKCTLRIFSHSLGGVLDILPSTLNLVEVQNAPRQTENKLKAWLREKAVDYDYVIIDCPPTISIFTEAAILASDKYVVPIKPDALSVVGLPLLERYIEDFSADLGIKMEQIGMVFTMVRGPVPKAMKELMDELRLNRKGMVFQEYLSQATSVAESASAQVPLVRYKKASQRTKLQIVDITKEFLKRTGG